MYITYYTTPRVVVVAVATIAFHTRRRWWCWLWYFMSGFLSFDYAVVWCGIVWQRRTGMIHSHRKHVINGRNAQNTRLINLYALPYLNNVYMDAQHSTHPIKCKTDMEKLWRVRVPNDPSTYSHTRTHVLVGSIHREAHFMEITFSDCALCCAVCCRCAHITSNCCLHNF